MKKILIFLSLMLFASEAWAACTSPCVQVTTASVVKATTSTVDITFATLPVVGHVIYPVCSFTRGLSGAPQFSSFTDNQDGNPYSDDAAVSSPGTTSEVYLASKVVATSAGTYTITMHMTGNAYMVCFGIETLPTSAVDQSGASTASAATGITVTAGGATSSANEIVIAVSMLIDSGSSNVHLSTPSGYSELGSYQNDDSVPMEVSMKTISLISTPSASWTNDLSVVQAAIIATYPYTPASGGGICQMLLLGVC